MPSTLTPPPGSGWPRAYTVPAVVLLALLALVGLLARRRRRPSPDFVRVFPPSRRHALQHLLRESAKTQRSSIPDDAPAPNVLQVQALPMAATPAHFRKGGLYTPTGFRLDEVASLGVFPDYAVLSGVRHPEPCGPNFDLSRACFRPFRPFRWGYHQTMASPSS
ncbi:hypothetical protein VTK73DRAFT_1351 [Phialemonium thermophilum]|uniref:Uncharacterized protein n=1 Tax=Phialemonium thermophilum TaxID=223376 RepID=A0ABR3VTM3_9PEZI